MSPPDKLGLFGAEAQDLKTRPTGAEKFLDSEVLHAFRIDRSRSGAAQVKPIEIADNQPIEIEFENGLVRWVSMGTLRKEVVEATTRGGGPGGIEDGVLWMPPELSIGGTSRDGTAWALKTLRVFGIKATEKVGGWTAARLCRALEEKLVPSPGLRHLTEELEPDDLVDPARLKVADGEPVLVLLHGTASKTQGAFGDLVFGSEKAVWQELRKRYGKHSLLGLEHHTLSESPIENAIQFLERVPKGARLHFLSHSRGGLVGDLLCLSRRRGGDPGFNDAELEAFAELFKRAGADVAEQRELLTKFNALLREKAIRVDRFVRVAATAGGTTLAGKRLDDLASLLGNGLRLAARVSSNPAIPTLVEFVSAFAQGMISARASWDDLPGLAAQMPDSPLVRVLNTGRVEVEGRLAAVAGDADPRGLSFRSLFVFASDRFFGEPNDFIVQTSSMSRGATRQDGKLLPYSGKRVWHCNYFAIEETVQALSDGLAKADLGGRWQRIAPAAEAWIPSRDRGEGEPRPLVVVVPGIMGSHLAVEDDRVWLQYSDLAFGGLTSLHIQEARVRPDGLLGRAYGDVSRFLERQQDVEHFAFDWRISLVEEAERFSEALRAWMDGTSQPVRILAHSMGGLLCRLAFGRDAGLWQRFADQDGRLVMLGTPNGGSYTIPRVLFGHEKVIRQLITLDVFHGPKRILGLIARFPGLLQMLPRDRSFDLFQARTWKDLRAADHDPQWTVPKQEDLDLAKRVRDDLDDSEIDPERMLYVAGVAPSTPIRFEKAEGRIDFVATQRGDGRVPWSTGIPEGIERVWYMNAAHGDLAAHAPAFTALEELLLSGTTRLLETSPPVTRGADVEIEMRAEAVLAHPSEQDLTASAMGGGAGAVEPVAPSIAVTVKQADLGFARYPVFVGHYQGDQIVHAERALDARLGNELRFRYSRGQYPGRPEEVDVVFNAPGHLPRGGVVVGLGKPGELSSGALEATVLAGILKLETELRARVREECREESSGLGISTLLIGSGEGGLRTFAAMQAVLMAVKRANERFQATRDDDSEEAPRVTAVEFVELYEDRALHAQQVVEGLCKTPRFAEFVAADRLDRGRGGRRRAFSEDDPSWWWRINVLGEPESDSLSGPLLRFSFATGTARGARHQVQSNPATVDLVLARATRSTARNDRLGQTLFELLVPNPVKDLAPDARPVLLMLDEEAARYPWELLTDPSAASPEPVSIRSGMIRQLYTTPAAYSAAQAPPGRALVIANPRPTHLADLPSATEEGKAIQQILAADGGPGTFGVRLLEEPTPDQILNELFASSDEGDFGYQILHIAAHGEYHDDNPESSGVVIGVNGHLTAGTFKQLRRIPELVFLSCCHLGVGGGAREGTNAEEADENSGGWKPLHLAANLGTELIRMGVKAVIAAGWAVDDQAANIFATSFYRAMMANDDFGTAVQHARRETLRERPAYNTWAAFQAYGRPDFRLGSGSGRRGRSEQRYGDPVEAVIKLDNLRSRSATVRLQGYRGLKESIETTRKELAERKWLEHALCAEALGRAYGELGEFGSAIEHLTAAASADRSAASIRCQEELENYRARDAFTRWYESDGKASARRDVRTAIGRIETLIGQHGPNTERLCLRGSARKRMACIAPWDLHEKPKAERTGPEEVRRGLLEEAFEDYDAARQWAVTRYGHEDAYPLTNWIALYAVRFLLGDVKATSPFTVAVNNARGLITDAREDHPFFGHCAGEEIDFLEGIILGGDGNVTKKAVDGYDRALRRGGTVKELFSARDQFRVLEVLLRTRGTRGRRAEAYRAVRTVLAGLDDLVTETLR